MAFRPIPDSGVLKTADAFQTASKSLCMYSDQSMLIPAIVNSAFALELYLKSLNIKWDFPSEESLPNGKSWVTRYVLCKGHAPSKLYKTLDQNIQDTLERKFADFADAIDAITLKERLQAYDGIFQDWRYPFEGHCNPVDLADLHSVLSFLSETIHCFEQDSN